MEAKNVRDKVSGLLKYNKPRALILWTRFGIHTIGMKYAIDVMILDSEGKVVKIKSNLKPNNIFLWNPTYRVVIELPAATINKSKTQLNDVIKYEL